MSYSYVALDVETANDFRGSVCSIGLVKFKDGNIVDTFLHFNQSRRRI